MDRSKKIYTTVQESCMNKINKDMLPSGRNVEILLRTILFQMMEKEIQARRAHMSELNSAAQDLVDAGHIDPDAVKEQTVVMEER